MGAEPLSGNTTQGQSRTQSNDYQDRSFMGGIGLSTRASLFIMTGILVLLASGFALHYADKELRQADLKLSQATQLRTFATTIERDIWRIRAEQGALSNRATDASNAAILEHLALAGALGQRLDDLYARPEAAHIDEQISTLREAVALYAEEYQRSMQKEPVPGPDMTGLEANMRRSTREIGKLLVKINSLSINETMLAIRAATTAFIESGAGQDLVVIENQKNEFSRLLTSIPIALETKNALRLAIDAFDNALAAYAKVRLVAGNTRDRLDEIISYMAPSVDAINNYAGGNFAEAESLHLALRQRLRTLIAAGGGGSVMLVLLFGLIMMRSISKPMITAAEAARKLMHGNTDIAVLGLGNEDETGDIARAFWSLKESLKQASQLGETMEKAKAEAERGRAASTEAEWLRRDLESMKAEADKGREALTEVALLRKVIDATADTVGRNQISDDSKQAAAREPANDTRQEMSMDTISSISRQVAQSSEYVTAAADEAERTGTLIRNLGDAAEKISAIEHLIAEIGEHSDMLVVNAPPQSPDTNLVILNGDAHTGGPANPDAIARRFDAIRSAASQANWAIRDISGLIKGSREVALDIARLSSTEALEVTTDLLQQSENLRGMLDKLVNKMQTQISDVPGEDSSDSDLLS